MYPLCIFNLFSKHLKGLWRDKQRLDSDRARGSQDSMDDSRSPTGVLRTNAFCQIFPIIFVQNFLLYLFKKRENPFNFVLQNAT